MKLSARSFLLSLFSVVLLPQAGSAAPAKEAPAKPAPASTSAAPAKAVLQVTSKDFAAGAPMPANLTGDGKNESPALHWSGLPAATKSVAVICTDSDAPKGVFWHWMLFNLPPQTTELKANYPKDDTFPNGSAQGRNDFEDIGYTGPNPPKGPVHHYHFMVYALDGMMPLRAGCSKANFIAAVKGHVLGSGDCIGTYKH